MLVAPFYLFKIQMVRVLFLVVLLVTFGVILVCGDDIPNFKKMRVKEMKSWMTERGLSCPDCDDKAALVKFCTNSAKNAPKVVRPKAPTDKALWEAWSMNAKEICDAQAKKSGADNEKVCSAIASATDSFFMQHGKRTANKLRKKTDAMLKTSYADIYYPAARRLFTRLSKHCLSNPKDCATSTKVQSLIEGTSIVDFTTFLTNIGIENTNPMYDILNDKAGLDHDEL